MVMGYRSVEVVLTRLVSIAIFCLTIMVCEKQFDVPWTRCNTKRAELSEWNDDYYAPFPCCVITYGF